MELIEVKVKIEPKLSLEERTKNTGHKRERANHSQVVTYTGIGEQVSSKPLPPIVFYKLLLHNRGYSSIPILPSTKRCDYLICYMSVIALYLIPFLLFIIEPHLKKVWMLIPQI